MRDPGGSGMVEPDVTINGKALTFAQALTLRVAISSFHMYVTDERNAKALGPIAHGYADRCAEIEAMILGAKP